MSFRIDRFVDNVDPLVRVPIMLRGLQSDQMYQITQKAASYDLQSILDFLSHELSSNELYSETWRLAEKRFEQKKSNLLSKAIQPIPNQCHVAIIAYTMDAVHGNRRKLYREFNKECHVLSQFPPHASSSPDQLADEHWYNFPYKSLFCLLMHALSGVRSNPDPRTAVTYRGVSMYYNLDELQDEILTSFGHFASTSADKNQAEGFIPKEGTLFCFNVNSMAAAGISQYSEFPAEKEILIFPWSTFAVDHVDQKGRIHYVYMHGEGPFIPELPYSLCSPIDEYRLDGYQSRKKCIGCHSNNCQRKQNPPKIKWWPFS